MTEPGTTMRVTVVLTEPVAVGVRPGSDFHQETHSHIPGSVLRGALAALWIRHYGKPSTQDETFTRIFEGPGSFGPLHSALSLPVPLSVKQHKYLHQRDCRELWWDAARGDTPTSCRRCGQALEFGRGEPVGRVERVTRVRTSLDADGKAKERELYSRDTLPAETQLRGWVHGPAVEALFRDGQPITELLLGGGRSIRGAAAVHIDEQIEPDPVETDGRDVILRLAVPGIFVDRMGLPSHDPDLTELSTQLGVEAVEITGRWTRWTEAGGWHAASGLPKPTERAVAAGSTYRVRCAERPSEQARAAIMARGIGLRRREGFGALYPIPTAPLGQAAWTALLAPLRRRPHFLPLLRQRVEQLRRGTPDDSRWTRALESGQMEQDYADALRALLAVTDPDTYQELLDFVEQR